MTPLGIMVVQFANQRRGHGGSACTPRETGFTLLELVISLTLAAALAAAVIPVSARVCAWQSLNLTTTRLLYQLRAMQQLAQTRGMYGLVRMSMYTPEYWLYCGTGAMYLGHYTFLPGVNYKDGYLQLGSANIQYDVLGNCEVGGVIRLVDGPDEQDIHLYIGSGLQSVSGTGVGG